MPNIRPITDLRKFKSVKEDLHNGPVFLTEKGYGKYVLLTNEQYEELREGKGELLPADACCGSIQLGKIIVTLRDAKGMTQESLAASSNIDTERLAVIEAGEEKPSKDELSRLADALGVDPATLETFMVPGKFNGILAKILEAIAKA